MSSSSTPSVAVSTSSESKTVVAAPLLPTLAGKVAIVTGASRGIGAGTALRLARDGAKVVVNYNKDKVSADKVVAAINSTTPSIVSAIAVQGDASKSDDIDRLFAEGKRQFGKIDIVVANAGIFATGTIATYTNQDFEHMMNNNVKSAFYTLRAAANNIADNGRIVVIGSIVRHGLFPAHGPYAASKVAIEVLANTLAQELGGRGITVNTLHPGPIDTDMGQAAATTPEAKAHMANMSPQKRIGTVADVGDAVALFVSDGARWISGQNVLVTGAAK